MHRCIQMGLKAGVSVCAPKLSAQKSFLGQYILSSTHSDKYFVNIQGLHGLKKRI